MTAAQSPDHVSLPAAASGQGQAEPQEPCRNPEDFPFKCAECGDCHVEACCFLPACRPAQRRPGWGHVPSGLCGFDVMEWRLVGIWRHHLWKHWKETSHVFKILLGSSMGLRH